MKMSDWTGLCEREKERGGEVIGVALTAKSMRELATDILSDASTPTRVYDKDGVLVEGVPGDRVTAGGRVGQLFNVAEGRKEVEFTPLADADTVTVRDADRQTRTVALAAV